MKNNLLTSDCFAFCGSVFGQSAKSVLMQTKMKARSPMIMVNEPTAAPGQVSAPPATHARRTSGNNQTSTVCNVATLGHAANALGSGGGSRTQVSFNQDL